MESPKNLTPTELEKELKKERFRDKELDNIQNDIFMENVMGNIEKKRKALKKVSPVYTQKYVAEKAGISLSTYKNYLSGYNIGFSLRMLKNIADTLGCKPSDFLD
ncbi:MAG: helix-turn-helix transcriptional regulator [Lachnospiraceae bacterium]|nr:helix-turn-helix transcriptional regulator [Lachnospiraceae bacterium]